MSFSNSISKPAATSPKSRPPAPENRDTTFNLRDSASPHETSPTLSDATSRVPPAFADFAFFAAKTSPLLLFSDFFFMAVMRLHHGHEKSAFSIHALTGSPTTGLPVRTGERALDGRVLLAIEQAEAYVTSLLRTTLETCGCISGQASFSSSLKFYLVKSWLTSYGLLDGFKICKGFKTSKGS